MGKCTNILFTPDIKKRIFGDREVPQKLSEAFERDFTAAKVGIDNGTIDGTFDSWASKYIKEKRELTAVQKGLKAVNSKLAKERFAHYTQESFKNPIEGVKSIMSFSTVFANQGRDSVLNRWSAMRGQYTNLLFAPLQESGALSLFLHEGLDAAAGHEVDAGVRFAMESLQKKTEFTGRPEYLAIAKQIQKVNHKFAMDMLMAGMPLRILDDYVSTQRHSRVNIETAGFEAWFKDTLPQLDRSRTFGVDMADEKKITEFMRRSYDRIRGHEGSVNSPIGGQEVEDTIMSMHYSKSLGDRMVEGRTLHFKDAASASAYHAKYGEGTLSENMSWDIARKTKMVAAVQKFGSNPEAAIENDLKRLERHFRNQGNKEMADKMKVALSDGTARNIYKEFMGTTNIPGSETFASISQGIRTMNVLSKLAFTGIRSLSNLAVGASQVASYTGNSIFTTHLKFTQEFLGALAPSERAYFSQKLSFMLNDSLQEALSQGVAGAEGIPGKLSSAASLMMKYTGQNLIQDMTKTAVGKMYMTAFADNAHLGFKELTPSLQASLLTHGIAEHDWDIISKAVEVMPDGRKMITAEKIASIDLKEVRPRAHTLKMTPQKYLREMELRYLGIMDHSAAMATTTARLREMSDISMGTHTGTVKGEALRLGFQFKSFAVNAAYIIRQIMNSAPDLEALSRGVAKSQGINKMGLAGFLAGTTVMGYVGQALIDTINGKGVKDPREPKTIIDAMNKGGAGGFFGDLLTARHDRFNFAETVLGPTFGQLAGPGGALITKATDKIIGTKSEDQFSGRSGTFTEAAARLVRSNIPFQQVPIEKQLLDALQYKVLRNLVRGRPTERAMALRRRDKKDRLQPLPEWYYDTVGQ